MTLATFCWILATHPEVRNGVGSIVIWAILIVGAYAFGEGDN